ncbi:hypothetical protein SPBR_04339 [Sporothrix brasiliensis 5110]|uniref:Uncharacterized protein n=1 Tax=Sporothrix brasiliensis 5110 TaxID=1398154 RepID=A0A0C2J8Y7_9PEZI|nr:uncharacterized protein SPBR_04339 [Sporothrix brasiliensis 5110]KIH93437.1 hypothetical protein SPBR_04339 [Sporothrix brasiliensis 5110]
MPRLTPAEKLSLVTRKNVRDEWENKKEEMEKKLSDKLGVAWTFDINPLAIFPYAKDDWGKTSLGSILYSYADGAVYMLSSFADREDKTSVDELNSIAHAHVLTMDLDEAGKNTYNGCEVQAGGRLAILFNEANFGVNTDQALDKAKLLAALNHAPPAPGTAGATTLSFVARASVRSEYDGQIEPIRAKMAKTLAREDIRLEPNFEAVFAKLSSPEAAGKVDQDNYERQLGYFMREYFDGVAYQLESQKFGSDDMLQEGFNEAVDKGIVAFRIVDKLSYGSYCEVVVEDGTLFVQSTLEKYGVNIGHAAEKIIDQL